jgi:hypothetical protein
MVAFTHPSSTTAAVSAICSGVAGTGTSSGRSRVIHLEVTPAKAVEDVTMTVMAGNRRRV